MKPLPNETFTNWFNRQGFKHFKAHELTWMFSRVNKGVKNSEPDRNLWMNIVPTIKILDDLREHLGKSITLTSSFRNLAYNRSVGSPDGSMHVQFKAVDFKVAGTSPKEVFAVLDAWRKSKKIVAAIGTYSNFNHIDTRGKNATW
jgi:uncharacterized protein YcbK (DUF882 family)